MSIIKSIAFSLALLYATVPAYALVSIVEEEDGSPSATPYLIKFANGNVTDNGDGTVSVADQTGSGDITSVGDVTSGAAFDGTQGTTLTFNNAGGDMTLDYDGTDLQSSKPFTTGTTGVSITGSNGSVTFLGTGTGFDEDLKFDFNTTTNEVEITSSTLVTDIDFNTIDINTDTLDLTGTGTINGMDAIDATGETTLEVALDIVGDCDSTGMSSVICDAASTTADGFIEIAIASEVDTGTDATRAISPDALAGSNLGEKVVQVVAFDFTTDTTIGDGKYYFHVPSSITGMNLVEVQAQVITAGTTNATNIDLARCAAAATGNACSGVVADMLSTNMTIDSGENSTSTAAIAAVIDAANDDVTTDQVIRVDVDAVSTTAAKGLIVTMIFRLP